MRHTPSLGLFACLVLAPLVAAEDAYVARYVGGLAQERGVFDVQGACTTSDAGVVVAGACNIPVQPGLVRVTAVDDVLGGMAFTWDAFTGSAPLVTCALSGWGDTVQVIELPEGCGTLDVYVDVYATTGTITVEQL